MLKVEDNLPWVLWFLKFIVFDILSKNMSNINTCQGTSFAENWIKESNVSVGMFLREYFSPHSLKISRLLAVL